MKNTVIDTDYFKFLTMDCKCEDVFFDVMQEIECQPVMHEYVYKHELMEHSFIKKLVENKKIIIYSYDSLMSTPEREYEYTRTFSFAYKDMNGRAFDESCDIKFYHHDKENLGEIHSVILAYMMNYDMLMSNDKGARRLVKDKLNTNKKNINVYDVEHTFIELIDKDNSLLKWKRIKPIVGQWKDKNPTDNEKYNRVKNIWKKESK